MLKAPIYAGIGSNACALGSRLVQIVDPPSAATIHYNYGAQDSLDGLIGRLESMTETPLGGSTTVLETYKYLGLSTIAKLDHPNAAGGTLTLSYIAAPGAPIAADGDQYTGLDRFGRVVNQLWTDSSGNVVDGYTYTYDQDGNVLSKVNVAAHNASGVGNSFDEHYTYDSLSRLVSTDRLGGTANDQTWTLDAMGNMNSTQTGSSTQTDALNAANQIQSVSTDGGAALNLAYDADGNLISDDHGNKLVYDAWNRLIQVKNAGGVVIAAYASDGMGNRITETTASAGGK